MKPVLSIVLAAAAFAPAASAAENSLTARAATTVGIFLASQGNAALIEIRQELQKDLRKRLQPYLPSRDEVAPESEPREAHPES